MSKEVDVAKLRKRIRSHNAGKAHSAIAFGSLAFAVAYAAVFVLRAGDDSDADHLVTLILFVIAALLGVYSYVSWKDRV